MSLLNSYFRDFDLSIGHWMTLNFFRCGFVKSLVYTDMLSSTVVNIERELPKFRIECDSAYEFNLSNEPPKT